MIFPASLRAANAEARGFHQEFFLQPFAGLVKAVLRNPANPQKKMRWAE
jgi:hypothetical protein